MTRIHCIFAAAAAAAASAALCGCSAVLSARESQQGAAAAAEGRVLDPVPADLSGATLQDLVAFAVSNRPSVVSSRLGVEDARLQLKQIASDAPLASTTPWNAADVSARIGYSETSPSAHFENLGRTRKGKMTGSLSLDLLLWDAGRNSARVRAQTENVIAAELSLVQEGYTVFEEVSVRYFALLQEEALREVAVSNLAQYAEHLERAKDMLELGEAKNLDVLRAELDLAESREALVAASNSVTVAGANLMAALGIDISRGDYLQVLGERGVMLEELSRRLPETAGTSREMFDFARTNAPSMRIARAKLRAASADVDYAIADLMPSFSASLSMNWTDPLWYWRWGLDAVQSVFTGWRKTSAVERATVALESAKNSVDALEQDLSRKIEIAIAERDNAKIAEQTAADSLASAKENLETVKAQFEVGDASRVEFSEAVSSFAAAQGNMVKAFYRGQSAEAYLYGLAGIDPVYVQ